MCGHWNGWLQRACDLGERVASANHCTPLQGDGTCRSTMGGQMSFRVRQAEGPNAAFWTKNCALGLEQCPVCRTRMPLDTPSTFLDGDAIAYFRIAMRLTAAKVGRWVELSRGPERDRRSRCSRPSASHPTSSPHHHSPDWCNGKAVSSRDSASGLSKRGRGMECQTTGSTLQRQKVFDPALQMSAGATLPLSSFPLHQKVRNAP